MSKRRTDLSAHTDSPARTDNLAGAELPARIDLPQRTDLSARATLAARKSLLSRSDSSASSPRRGAGPLPRVERSPRSGRSATRGPRAPRVPRPEGAEELSPHLPHLLRALILGACITLPVGLALAQRALDANLRVGSGGRNSYNSAAFPVSSPSPFTVNRNTGEMTHNWANATNERPGGVYSSAFRRSGGDIALGRGDFAPAPPPRQFSHAGLSQQRYTTLTTSLGAAPPVSARPPRGVSGLQNQSYSPLAAPLNSAAAKPADPAKSLQRGTYTPIR